jgi:hypothetical protein
MRKVILILAIICLPTTLWAADPFIGTWNMIPSKSTFSYPAPKSFIMIIKSKQGEFECVEDVITADGKAIRRIYSGKYDGKDYPIKGDPDMDTISFMPIIDHKSTYVIKKDGKVVLRGESVISEDGKTWIDNGSGKDASGKAFTFTIFLEKQ